MRMTRHRHAGILIVLPLLISCAAPTESREPQTRHELLTMEHGPVCVRIAANVPAVDFARDLILSITIAAPAHVRPDFPDLHDRFRGFALMGIYEEVPAAGPDQTRHVRLRPLVADRYGIAPFAVVYTDLRKSPARTSWFVVPAVTIDVDPTVKQASLSGLRTALPLRPADTPPFNVLTLFMAVLALLAAAAAVLAYVRRTSAPAALSPAAHASAQLEALLKQNLPQNGQVREFYSRLTDIVRCYLEDRYEVRAPESTTEEFLATVADDQRFRPERVAELKTFLETADLVKFAKTQPDPQRLREAVARARAVWENDEDAW